VERVSAVGSSSDVGILGKGDRENVVYAALVEL
jgi:hypothetical protein